MTLTHLLESCTTYSVCAIILDADINWGALGAGILLIARLVKDVPDAIEVVQKFLKKRKKKKNGKSKR